MGIYIIGDTHFSDPTIMDYEQRPFDSIYEMNIAMVNKWNELITPEDTVFHLGDLAGHGVEKSRLYKMIRGLNGHKSLIMGNHDTWTEEDYRDCGFEQLYKYPIIIEGFWMLSHEPLYMVANSPYVNIHAHIHGNLAYKDYSKTSYCVSVERTDYTPVSLDHIKDTIELARGI